MSELSISSDGRDDPAVFGDKVAAGEAGGADTIWIANHLFLRDPAVLGALTLSETRRLKVALMAVSPLTQHPVQIAMAATTLAERFPGRVKLCLGVGAPADLAAIGVDGARPLRAMREALLLVRALLSGETVTFQGETFRTDRRRLAAAGADIPIVLAASGPQMLELAGTEADGVLISAGASVPFVAQTLQSVARGAKGREIRTSGLVYASVDDDERHANDRLRRILAILLRGAHHKTNLGLAGTTLDQQALNDAVLAEDWSRAEAMIGDDIVARHAASGTPEQLRRRLAEYHASGLDEIVIAGVRDGAQIKAILESS
ncbi:LLM class flavin-dependent oxidoreductase [Rhodopseudomonas palustris]|uniref:LLM class flavin-dependent oxidoreductase n=1 Tax=Rhodopseudomonas palustris TaxID=1076 RepID=UPI002ACEC9B0|nr:LLM class flavin-dependent oxidoreductase [Rhodopseudomonas palustris]WQG97790.1 LLM class flavin-dependent oxidoreductase [Rhodopseudomonas palustris]